MEFRSRVESLKQVIRALPVHQGSNAETEMIVILNQCYSKSRKFAIAFVLKEFKPVAMGNFEFEFRDLSTITSIWPPGTIEDPTRGTHSFLQYKVILRQNELSNETFMEQIYFVDTEKFEFEPPDEPLFITIFAKVRIFSFPYERLK